MLPGNFRRSQALYEEQNVSSMRYGQKPIKYPGIKNFAAGFCLEECKVASEIKAVRVSIMINRQSCTKEMEDGKSA